MAISKEQKEKATELIIKTSVIDPSAISVFVDELDKILTPQQWGSIYNVIQVKVNATIDTKKIDVDTEANTKKALLDNNKIGNL